MKRNNQSDQSIFKNGIIYEDQKNLLMESEQATGWVLDSKLGFRLPDGQDFIGENNFITYKQLFDELKTSNKQIILNIGDSSTTGWDIEVHIKNMNRLRKGLTLKPAFFRYRTYTDILRNQLGDKFTVINAGVPGYSSYQGTKRLEILLSDFKQHHLAIKYVTTFYGNNDSSWWRNGEDKAWVGVSEPPINHHDFAINKVSHNSIITRVIPEDYKLNLISILTQCRSENIIPIFIEPVTSIYWRPNVLDKNRIIKSSEITNQPVRDLLNESIHLWEVAIKQSKYSEMKQLLLEEAREKDFLTSRIKRTHLRILRDVTSIYNVPLVSVKLDRSKDDRQYFMDCNHPNEKGNQLIADGVQKIIASYEKGKVEKLNKVSKKPKPPKFNEESQTNSITTDLNTQYPLF